MPLSADEFDSAGEQPVKLLQFLWEHADTAFTFSEMAELLRDSDFTLDDIDYSLRALVEAGRIERRFRDEKVYYMYRETGG